MCVSAPGVETLPHNRIAVPRRSVLARVLWRDDAGKEVQREGVVTNFAKDFVATAEPEYPRESGAGKDGWVEMSGVYVAPPGATQARVELHLLWAPKSKIEWSDVAFLPTEALPQRKVRLASVHYRPRGAKTPIDACRQFAPLIEEAARRKADLVVLGETLTYAGVNSSYADCAETIPGPPTDCFGELAMMICYDGFFPEVARELSNRGAEIIAWPVWGCNPEQARARACENQVYIVSSTYEGVSRNWMLTAAFGQDGSVLAQAKDWGTACVGEVDLNKPTLWTWLGEFKSQIPRQCLVVRGE